MAQVLRKNMLWITKKERLYGTATSKHSFMCLRPKRLKFIALCLVYRYVLEDFPLIKANELSTSFISKSEV